MSTRARRLSLTGLALLTGASLLRTSISVAFPSPQGRANLSLRLSQMSVAAGTGLEVGPHWALSGAPAADLVAASSVASPSRFPDGVRVLGLQVKVGREGFAPVFTNAETTGQLLRALKVPLAETDLVLPSPDAALRSGMKVRVVRIRKTVETEVESLSFDTLVHYSGAVPVGTATVVTPGTRGEALRSVEVTYRNGRAVDRKLLSYVLLTSPLPRVEIHGSPLAAPGVSHTQYGEASWYDCSGMYAAHLSLPFGTVVTVTNLDNGETVTVVINDRGPYGIADRIIDLCSSAFAQIAPLAQGVARVKITW